LDFSDTSVTGNSGVFGVGLGIVRNSISESSTLVSWNNGGNKSYTVFAVFGDGTTANLFPPPTFNADDGFLRNAYAFWGFTSPEEIVSIHLGLPNGETTAMSAFILGDLTIASPVPIPPAVWLFGSGLIGLVGIARRKATALGG